MAGDRWYPVSDHALEVLRIRDVGGGETPLVGAYSRFGWNHPGPLLFWVLAPPYRVLGEVGLLVGAAALNAGALVGTLLVARRRGGTALVVFVAAGCAVLCHAIGPELLIDPWNAWVPVIPLLLYALLAWSVAERDWPTLPWLVGVGSFVVQSHFGYTPLVAGLGLAAAGLAAWTHVPIAGRPRSVTRRELAITAGVAIVLWLPPLLQQLTGSPGNLGELVGVARDPDEDVAGWAAGFGLMGRELEVFGPLFTGEDRGFLGIVHPASTLAAISLVVATGLVGAWASHRGCKSAGRLALIGVVFAGLGVVAASRISGLVVPYLLRWSWVIATLLWVSLLWSVWSILRRTPVAVGLVAGVAVVAVAFVATTAWSAVSIATPTATASTVVEHLAPSTARHLSRDKQYLVTWVERQYLTGIGPGMVLELTNRGYTVGVQKRVAHRFSDRRISSRSEVDGVITIVDGASELGWTPPAGARLIARYQPSTARDRARRRLLRTRVDAVIANACGEAADSFDRCALLAASRDRVAVAALDELADIDQRGDPYVVYLSSRSQSKSSMR